MARREEAIKILFVGDVVGKPGRRTLGALLPGIVGGKKIDFVIANGENAAGGMGLTPAVAEEIFALGVDVLTSGNHIWKKKEIEPYLQECPRLLRPWNYPAGAPGRGEVIGTTAAGVPVGVVNLEGRVFMKNLECPFRGADMVLEQLRAETQVIVVDFHAEATSEKLALAYYLDGRVSAVVGTHTHVQTADERILDGGTGYITDVGMTGPTNSVLGVKKEEAIKQLMAQRPTRFTVAKSGCELQALVLEISTASGKTRAVERLRLGLEMNKR